MPQSIIQRTIGVPVERAFAAWAEPGELDRWFTSGAEQDFREGGRYGNDDGDGGEFRRIVPNQLIRFTWENPQHRPGSVVEVEFLDKGPGKATVRLTHGRLSSPEEVENLRDGWAWDPLPLRLTRRLRGLRARARPAAAGGRAGPLPTGAGAGL